MIRSFLKFTDAELETIYSENVTPILPIDKRVLLEELLLVLDGIYEATLCLQKEDFSIGHVLPLYRGIELCYIKSNIKVEKFKLTFIFFN